MKTSTILAGFCSLILCPAALTAAEQTPSRDAAPAKSGIPATKLQPSPAAGAKTKATRPTLQPGAAAPDFLSLDLAGKEFRLSSWRDKVIVLDFWATWCGPCMASLPHTQEVARRFKAQGVVVLAVCTSDTRAKFEPWVKANQKKYPDLVFTCDPNDRGSATFEERASFKLFGVTGIPTQFVIGRDGKIAAVLVGYEKGDRRLEEALANLGIKANPEDTSKGGS